MPQRFEAESDPKTPAAQGAPASPDAPPAAETQASALGEAGGSNGRREVLVVEDDPEINELVGAYACLAGFNYRSALDGTSALAEVRRQLPTVIVFDLMLPDFDGFEVCRRVKREPGARNVPVIILTALDNDASRRQGVECGAADYLTKPFDPDQLMATIAQHAEQTD